MEGLVSHLHFSIKKTFEGACCSLGPLTPSAPANPPYRIQLSCYLILENCLGSVQPHHSPASLPGWTDRRTTPDTVRSPLPAPAQSCPQDGSSVDPSWVMGKVRQKTPHTCVSGVGGGPWSSGWGRSFIGDPKRAFLGGLALGGEKEGARGW